VRLIPFLFPLLAACATSTRHESVSAAHGVDGLEVTARPSGNVGYTICVTNRTRETVKLLWDESSYVASDGRSLGRLIRGQTRQMDTAKAQPPSPIAPGATFEEWCVPEGHVEYVGVHYGVFGGWAVPKVANPHASARLLLSFEMEDGRRDRWEGSVRFHDASADAP
jgi:hypothetical protein